MSLITPNASTSDQSKSKSDELRVVAYNMDMLFPGLYIWVGSIVFRLGGQQPEDSPYRYPGTVNSKYGIALVLPGYKIFTTYKGSFDNRSTF
jgi:hypothetical protein